MAETGQNDVFSDHQNTLPTKENAYSAILERYGFYGVDSHTVS
jgi:hypothetical protein